MAMHHCPRCELRFLTTSELRQHFAVDHEGDAGTFEPYRYRAGPASEARAERTLLVVGNQTLEDESVLREVVARAASHERVLVLVPATNLAAHDVERSGAAIAEWRLRAALDHLRSAGVAAEGRVGDADPFVAITQLLAEEHVDDIVVSTLPPASSRWLDVDLPERVRRVTHRPVAVLTPVGAPHQ